MNYTLIETSASGENYGDAEMILDLGWRRSMEMKGLSFDLRILGLILLFVHFTLKDYFSGPCEASASDIKTSLMPIYG